MGDLGKETAVEPLGGGRYRATLSGDWEIWGPMGGYIASVALRAAGAGGAHPFPAAFSCHYLGVAAFTDVDITVEARRQGRNATSQRVEITQGGRPVLDAMVWSAAEVEGLEHDESVAPDVPDPEGLTELGGPGGIPQADVPPFWRNPRARPVEVEPEWPPSSPRPAAWRQWVRFDPTPDVDDPWVDAARMVVLADLPSWPAAHRPHAWRRPPFIAPTLDLNVAFHRPAPGSAWLLVDGTAPVSTRGLFGWTSRVWSAGGLLHASGGGQCLYRRI